MALNDLEYKRVENALERFIEMERPPVHIRPELDLAYTFSGQSVELCEVRPHWENTNEKMLKPYAKARYVKTQNLWKIYWQRADLKWHSYEPVPTVSTIEEFLAVVKVDEYACFYGSTVGRNSAAYCAACHDTYFAVNGGLRRFAANPPYQS